MNSLYSQGIVTILIVGGVEYFFLRPSGRFDGTGGMAVNRNVGL